MDQLIINGGAPLHGRVEVSGAKNAALGIIAAALLADGISTIENVPCVNDVRVLIEAIMDLGVKVTLNSFPAKLVLGAPLKILASST